MDTDRNLLFAVLCLQADLIDNERFVDACTLWTTRKTTPLSDLLVEQGWVSAEEKADIDRLLERKLKKHGGNLRASLATVANSEIHRVLAVLQDSDVQTSLSALPVQDAYATPTVPAGPIESRERYLLMRLHASGGIGRIWVARDGELGREVALKELLPQHPDHPRLWTRFLQEAKITGQLQHPGIVPIYELSRQPVDQRPFYTMRLVQGRTLAAASRDYHGRRRLGKAEPLELNTLLGAFCGVCNAIAYAHSRGVIHRDLKGQNVIVGDYGEVIVLDWGLAKVLGQSDDHDDTPLINLTPDAKGEPTMMGQVLGTPAHMAPEQASGRIDLIGPRTDVYGLGTILYEILTGQPPFLGTRPEQVLRKVCEEDPKPPRAVCAGLSPALEAICMKAIARKQEDRYASAAELAEEVKHWLGDEPVRAHREAWPARLGRWARRHRGLVQVSVALLLTAVVALAISTYAIRKKEQAAQFARNQERAAREQEQEARQRADRNFALARDAVDKTIGKVAENRRLREANFHGLRKDLLETAIAFYEEFVRQQSDDPELEAARGQAYGRLAFVQAEMGQREAARQGYEQMRAIFTRLSTDHPDLPEYRRSLAESNDHLGNLLLTLGRRTGADSAESAHRAALAIREALVAEFPDARQFRQDLARSHDDLGLLLKDLGRRTGADSAESALRAGLALRKQLARDFSTFPDIRQELARSYNNFGTLLNELGRRTGQDSALEAFRSALAIQEKLTADFATVPQYRQDLARTHNNLGALYTDLGRRTGPDSAESSHRAAVKIFQKLAADFPNMPEYRQDLGESYNGLGILLADLGRETGPDSAESSHRAALAIRKALANEFPDVPEYRQDLAETYSNLGELLHNLGRRTGPDGAEAAHRSALAIRKKLADDYANVPEFREDLAASHNNLGLVLADLDRVTGQDGADSAHRAALAIYEDLAAGAPEVASYAVGLGGTYGHLGDLVNTTRPQEALAWYGRALGTLEPIVARDPRLILARAYLASAYHGRAETLDRLGRQPEAARDWDKALSFIDPKEKAALELAHAQSLLQANDAAGALRMAERAVDAAKADVHALYAAARFWAQASVKLPGEAQERSARRAVDLLRQAVSKGYRDLDRLEKESDLDPLRRRQEFTKLLQDVRKAGS
jgi:serine/threonine-protein kinase